MYDCALLGDQKGASEPLVLESQMVVSHHVSAGDLTLSVPHAPAVDALGCQSLSPALEMAFRII